MTYKYTFEKLEVWKKAIELTAKVYEFSKGFPNTEIYGLTSQVRRATISISTNIAEGSARTSYKEKVRFFSIAYGSCIECISLLVVAFKLEFCSRSQYDSLRLDFEEISRMINALQKKTKGYVT